MSRRRVLLVGAVIATAAIPLLSWVFCVLMHTGVRPFPLGNAGCFTKPGSDWYGDSLARWRVTGSVGPFEIVTFFAMASDGRHVAYVHGPTSDAVRATRPDHGLHLVTPGGGETALVATGLGELPIVVEFSPDDSKLAAGFPSGRIAVWSVATGALVASNSDTRRGIRSLAFAADGQVIFAACVDGEVWVFQSDLRGDLLFETGDDWMQGRYIALRDNGREVVVVGGEQTLVARTISVKDKGVIREFDLGSRGIQSVRLQADLSFDGKYLVTCGVAGRSDIWDAASAKYLRTLDPSTDSESIVGIEYGTFSPDSLRILFVGNFGLQLWDFANGTKIWELEYMLVPDDSTYRARARFSRDGRQFAAVRPRPDGRGNEIAIYGYRD